MSSTPASGNSPPDSGNTPPTMILTPTSTISVGGLDLIIPDKKNAPAAAGILFPKEHRPTVGSKEEKELIYSINTNSYDKYTRVNINIKDADSLKNNLTVTQRLVNTEEQWERYDLLGPCHILFPDPNNPGRPLMEAHKPKSVYLFKDHRQVTVQQVAESCELYSQWMQFPIPGQPNGTFNRELTWSYTHFRNHVDASLYEDINTSFKAFPQEQQGGPLFLKILLDRLVVSNDQNLRELTTSATKYNIKEQCPDEDINQAVKILSNVTNNIVALRHDREHKLPENYIQHMLQVFQTTSVPAFNESFQKAETDLVYHRRFARTAATLGTSTHLPSAQSGAALLLANTPESASFVWEFAHSTYNELRESGVWDDTLRKPADSAFPAKASDSPGSRVDNNQQRPSRRTPTCWNCGKTGHTVQACPDPIDTAKVDANRLEFQNRAQTRTPRYFFRPPEAGEDNKRIINGKPHEWQPDIRRWKRVSTPSSGLMHQHHQQQPAQPRPPPLPLPPSKPAIVSDDDTVASGLTALTRMTDAQQAQLHLDLANAMQFVNEFRNQGS